jgi:tripeptide aminopeptidase
MVNAIKLASEFVARLPQDRLSPETTDGYDGYVHPYVVEASVDRTSVRLLIRDFSTAGLEEKETFVEELARAVVGAHAGSGLEIRIAESYRNMREILEGYADVVECAREAIRRSGLRRRERPIRGGTDGRARSWACRPNLLPASTTSIHG